MTKPRRRGARLAAGLSVSVGLGLILIATPQPSRAEPTSPPARVSTSKDVAVDGLAWEVATPEFNSATEPISELIHERSDIFSGSLLSSDATYVEIFVKAGSVGGAQALLEEAGVAPSLYLITEREHSAIELEQEVLSARNQLEAAGIAVDSLGIDPIGDGVSVVLASDGAHGRSAVSPATAEGALAGLAITGITQIQGGAVDFSSAADGPNSTAGARLTSPMGNARRVSESSRVGVSRGS